MNQIHLSIDLPNSGDGKEIVYSSYDCHSICWPKNKTKGLDHFISIRER